MYTIKLMLMKCIKLNRVFYHNVNNQILLACYLEASKPLIVNQYRGIATSIEVLCTVD
jgi:hypothetical protein